MKNTITVIPARGKSHNWPEDNLRFFCGRPLIAWSILQAQKAHCSDGVFVISEDDAVLDVAKAYGAIALKRPENLAHEIAEISIDYVLEHISGHMAVDWCIYLQATSPLRRPADIQQALGFSVAAGCDSLFSASCKQDLYGWKLRMGQYSGATFDPWNRPNLKHNEQLLVETGSIYIFKPWLIKYQQNRIGGKILHYEMPWWQSFRATSEDSCDICEYLFHKHNLPQDVQSMDTKGIAKEIEMIVYDFDGVMTDNKVLVAEDGKEYVAANRGDGLGVHLIRKMNIRQLILSSEANPVVLARAKKLKVEAINNCGSKKETLLDYCKKNSIDLAKVLYVGCEINDLEAMECAGYKMAPANANSKIKEIANYVLHSIGGQGVVRELSILLGQ